jgi:tRNA(Ile)-lysidine synthetase-like protein
MTESAESFASTFLKNSDMWFNPQKKYDNIIKKKYGHILDELSIFSNLLLLNSNKELLNFILICDQLPYYIYRDDKHLINKYQNWAYQVSSELIKLDRFNEFTDIEKCFIMLPLRHSNKLDSNIIILNKIKELMYNKPSNIYKRFFRATLLKIGLLKNDLCLDNKYLFYNSLNTNILDINCTFDKLYKPQFTDETIIKKLKGALKYIDNICVSISGGVDSILLLYILNHLGKNIIAIHINYKNRDTSDVEMKNVIIICNYLNIPIYVRSIDEVQRDNCDRVIYEEITRKIRFDFYNKIIKNNFIVALGHNRDDCIENIFSNITIQKKYDNLKGMVYLGIENDVKIIRPFLDINKKDIYYLANKYKLPYFYDSTPHWSDRGKKRDKLIPFLNNFDERIIIGLENLSNHIKSINKVYEEHIKMMVTFSDSYLCKLNKKIFDYDFEFFKSTMNYVCKTKQTPYFSKKCLEYLYNNITENRVIMLSNNYCFYNYLIKLL